MKNRTLDNIMAFFTGLLLFCCIFLGLESFAAEPDKRASCAEIGGLAESIMQSRQMGIGMDSVMAAAEGNQLFEMMIMDAYDEPRYSSENYIAKAVADFKNKWLLNCYKARKGK